MLLGPKHAARPAPTRNRPEFIQIAIAVGAKDNYKFALLPVSSLLPTRNAGHHACIVFACSRIVLALLLLPPLLERPPPSRMASRRRIARCGGNEMGAHLPRRT